MHGTGAALSDAAAEFGSRHSENVAQHPEQWHVSGSVKGFLLAIDCQRRCHTALQCNGRAPRTCRDKYLYPATNIWGVNGFFARLACRRARIAPNSGSPALPAYRNRQNLISGGQAPDQTFRSRAIALRVAAP